RQNGGEGGEEARVAQTPERAETEAAKRQRGLHTANCVLIQMKVQNVRESLNDETIPLLQRGPRDLRRADTGPEHSPRPEALAQEEESVLTRQTLGGEPRAQLLELLHMLEQPSAPS